MVPQFGARWVEKQKMRQNSFNSFMRLPDFVGIGAQRAATTWFYECLKEHPEVFVPDTKEVHFFNQHYDKGIGWYAQYFEGAGACKAVGELTPNYLNNQDSISRMAQILPHIKLFVVFRDPVDRTFSAYKLLNQQFDGLSFKEACAKSQYLLQLSLYSKNFMHVLSCYHSEKIKIFLYDDVKNDPISVLQQLFSFLNVNQHFVPSAKNKVYNAILFPELQRRLEKFGMNKYLDSFKTTPLGEFVKTNLLRCQNRINKKKNSLRNHNCEKVDDDFRQELRLYFRDDVLKLQELINRDLSKWIEGP